MEQPKEEVKTDTPSPPSVQGRCLNCKKLVEFIETSFTQTKNNRKRAQGVCKECGKKVSKFVKT